MTEVPNFVVNQLIMSTHKLLVTEYCRNMPRELDIEIPNDILLVIVLFFPNFIDFEGCKMDLTDDEKTLITNWLAATISEFHNPVLFSTLLYDAEMHGKAAGDFHRKCDDHQNLFGIVKIKNFNHIIGFFVSKSFNENDPKEGTLIGNYVNDDKAF